MRSHFAIAFLALGMACTGVARSAWAETGGGTEVDREAGVIAVTGASVADMAGFIVSSLNDSGTIPDSMQAKTTEGEVQRLSATEGFVALARVMRQWDVDGSLPASVPVAVGAVSAPVLSVADLPDQIDGEAAPRVLSTDLFVAQSAEVVRRLGQFRMVPAAIYVGKERLSAADYMAGMAIAIDYAYRKEKVETQLSLSYFLPPPAWVKHTESVAERVEEEVTEGDNGEEGDAEGGDTAAPAPAPSEKPKLSVAPAPGAKVTGVVDLMASYTGPPVKFISFSVDRQMKAVVNTVPYSYRWDTSRFSLGPHRVKVRALQDGNTELASVEVTYTVVAAPKSAK